MELFASWAVVVLFTVVIVLSHFGRRNGATGRRAARETVDTGFFSGYTAVDWGFLIAAICFFVGAIFGTLDALS